MDQVRFNLLPSPGFDGSQIARVITSGTFLCISVLTGSLLLEGSICE